MSVEYRKQIIIALDVASLAEARQLVKDLGNAAEWYKVGSQLFTAAGPEAVTLCTAAGKNVFLDLKFYDIPNTVEKAVAEVARLGVDLLTLHACGGEEMMRAARRAADAAGAERPRLLGVTVLTSMDDSGLRALGVARPVHEQVLHLAGQAQSSGLDGVVASVGEARSIRERCGQGFLIVTPGIRLVSTVDDQKRVATAHDAFAAGADYIVVGRPITKAEKPREAFEQLVRSIEGK